MNNEPEQPDLLPSEEYTEEENDPAYIPHHLRGDQERYIIVFDTIEEAKLYEEWHREQMAAVMAEIKREQAEHDDQSE